MLKRFWEIEEVSDTNVLIKPNEKQAWEIAEKSLQFKDGNYQVAIPWKSETKQLPDNYRMAVNRLENTEKKLLKNPELGQAYTLQKILSYFNALIC